MRFNYTTGEQIRKGDTVKFHGESGQVEFVAEPSIDDPKTAWHVREFGGGVMILEPKVFGRAFLSEPGITEDLIMVSRANKDSPEQLRQTVPNLGN